MKSRICFLFVISLMAAMAPAPVPAGDVTIPNTFQSGTPAVAAEVNANFSAVETAVDDNDSRIAALEAALATLQATVTSQASTINNLQTTVTSQDATITTLQTELDTVQSSQVMALDPYLTVDASGDPRGPLVQLAGVNLQIVNGEDHTDSINGLGNLIIGYDEVNTYTSLEHCSDGQYGDQQSCEDANEIWSYSHKSGSHYLVAGSQNNYSQYGGIVAGYKNFVTSIYSTVTGGGQNTAGRAYSSVSGGYDNTAGGIQSSVSGGAHNTANGANSSVIGGSYNTANGLGSSVSGGYENAANGLDSSVSGGYRNTTGEWAYYSSVSGGSERAVANTSDWRAGELWEDY